MQKALPSSMLCDLDEMEALCMDLAKTISAGSIITLTGDLGAGKTTFTSLLAKHLGIRENVVSPTFTYLNIYEGKLAHFDLYRLNSRKDFFASGFDEYLGDEFITLVEWPEIIIDDLPAGTIHVNLSHAENKRLVEIRV